jgi:hypothetical protein
MKSLIKLSLLVLFINVYNYAVADDDRNVTIHNILTGAMVYSDKEGANEYVSLKKAADVDIPINLNRVNWLMSRSGGYVYFKSNKFTSLCLSFEGDKYQLTQQTCNSKDSKQFFKLVPTDSGSHLIQVKEREQCFYSYESGSYFVYTADCPPHNEVVEKFLWSINPPLKE